MNAPDLLNLANEFLQHGENDTAVKLIKKCVTIDPGFGPAHLNLYNLYKGQNNLLLAREHLIKFLNSPMTGFTMDMVPKAKAELQELEKQMLGPQPK